VSISRTALHRPQRRRRLLFFRVKNVAVLRQRRRARGRQVRRVGNDAGIGRVVAEIVVAQLPRTALAAYRFRLSAKVGLASGAVRALE